MPEDFRFAVKVPKSVSHVLRLVGARAELARFMAEVTGLGKRLSVLLLQLPPSFVFDVVGVTDFLAVVRSLTDVRMVIEPRHASWFEPAADELLASLGVARVAADPVRVPAAALAGGWRGMTYVRLHGSPVMYRSAYEESRLLKYATMLAGEVAAGRPTWCMFDNTASSAALGDALQLQRFMEAGAWTGGR